jgi:peptidoglycan/xylan/chitin deacetylase (PgdA/CDA1 family)
MGRIGRKISQVAAQRSFRKVVGIPSDRRMVSFTFDDAPESAFRYAGGELERLGARATFYVALSLLERGMDYGESYGPGDLENCIARGHELGCHTFSHVRFHRTRDLNFISEDLHRNQEMLKELGIQKELQHFSYPYGEQTIRARKIVTRRYLTARGIKPGINRGRTDLFNLKAVKLYEGEYSLDTVFGYMDSLARNGGWLIFYTHDIRDGHSAFGCSERYFSAVLQKCAELDLEIRSVGEAVTGIL